MARSEYVYVLLVPDQPPLPWTVKHELRTWLAGQAAQGVSFTGWRLYRCRDGEPSAAMTTMSIAGVIEGKG